jgi:hypothetical protein
MLISKHLLLVFQVVVFWLLMPTTAEAFGPITHIHIGCQILDKLPLLVPVLGQMLNFYYREFLYGCIAADVIVAKNLASGDLHCHNWNVGFSVLENADTDTQRAFAWGYLCHLAADVIAHNYFVPWKLVTGFPSRITGHTYWEIRLDQKAPSSAWQLIEQISRQRFTEQNGLLARTIEGTIFRFDTNLKIFNGLILLQRLKRWRQILNRMNQRSAWELTAYETEEIYRMSIDSVLDLFTHQSNSLTYRADPAGIHNLKIAKNLRRKLRLIHKRQPWPSTQLETLLEEIRKQFRISIYEPLSLQQFSAEQFIAKFHPK